MLELVSTQKVIATFGGGGLSIGTEIEKTARLREDFNVAVGNFGPPDVNASAATTTAASTAAKRRAVSKGRVFLNP